MTAPVAGGRTLWISLWKTRDNGAPQGFCDIRVTTPFRETCRGHEKWGKVPLGWRPRARPRGPTVRQIRVRKDEGRAAQAVQGCSRTKPQGGGPEDFGSADRISDTLKSARGAGPTRKTVSGWWTGEARRREKSPGEELTWRHGARPDTVPPQGGPARSPSESGSGHGNPRRGETTRRGATARTCEQHARVRTLPFETRKRVAVRSARCGTLSSNPRSKPTARSDEQARRTARPERAQRHERRETSEGWRPKDDST